MGPVHIGNESVLGLILDSGDPGTVPRAAAACLH